MSPSGRPGAALRRARNQAQVLDALARPGITVEVLSEEREARMGWLAAHSIAPELAGVIDVGGGSTEVAAAGGTRWASAPVGATVLTERVGEEGTRGSRPDAGGATGDEDRAIGKVEACIHVRMVSA